MYRTCCPVFVLLLTACPDPTGAHDPLPPDEQGALVCANEAPLQLHIVGRATTEALGFEVVNDVEVWVERLPSGAVRYLDLQGTSATYVQTEPYRYLMSNETGCNDLTSLGEWYVNDAGMNIATGYLAFESRGGIDANGARYAVDELVSSEANGWPCLEVPEYLGIARCFSTDLCMDVEQSGTSMGADVLLEVFDVSPGFDGDPFAAVASCL